MKPGDIVEITEPIQGMKKNVYAVSFDLVTIISIHHLPVLLVQLYDNPVKTFPVHVEKVTTELCPKNSIRLKQEKEAKEKAEKEQAQNDQIKEQC